MGPPPCDVRRIVSAPAPRTSPIAALRRWLAALDRRAYAWLAAGFGVVMLGVRLWPGQVAHPLNLFEAFAAYAMLPVWPALGYARWRRLPELTALCLFLALAHVGWVLDFVPRTLPRVASAAADEVPLRLATVNLLAPVGSATFAREIAAMDADVVVASELSDRWARIFEDEGIYERYPHVVQEVISERISYFGIGILSRLPITAQRIEHVEGIPWIRVDLDVSGTPLRIYAFHAHPPMGAEALALWERQLDALLPALEADVAEGRSVVLTGDFNTTSMTHGYRRILGVGLRAAHEEALRPWASTWPNGTRMFPPVRLDHVFVRGAVVRWVREGEGEGSDHRPILTELRVHAQRTAPATGR